MVGVVTSTQYRDTLKHRYIQGTRDDVKDVETRVSQQSSKCSWTAHSRSLKNVTLHHIDTFLPFVAVFVTWGTFS
jgi:hypothetical protein